MDRVADFESVGWGFESLVSHHRRTVEISMVLFIFSETSESVNKAKKIILQSVSVK